MSKYTLYTYSVVYSSTEDFKDKTPYLTAILEDENGDRFASLVEGYEDGCDVCVGQEIKRIGEDANGKVIYSL
ncbi:OB-fold domain-containing protein [Rhodobacteraceae bacterium RKSG542]|uniref:OB-fold domain-containing protein n=1 Tax=Pseudovibrio flavus TaxID=2529854 RepID=UPI0012BB8AAF|nr:OB-fold domain-containing protein [Pseudovibrio flavus]MTI17741.1 OB-fold domain-containing protein [Pseudovibrio flavus]